MGGRERGRDEERKGGKEEGRKGGREERRKGVQYAYLDLSSTNKPAIWHSDVHICYEGDVASFRADTNVALQTYVCVYHAVFLSPCKVKDFAKVSFDARDLLENIVQIYLNLACHDSFCRAVCEDERSYSPELFEKTQQTLRYGCTMRCAIAHNLIRV